MLERSEQGEQTEIIILRTEENMRKISLILMVIHAVELFPGGAHASVLTYLKPDWGKKLRSRPHRKFLPQQWD